MWVCEKPKISKAHSKAHKIIHIGMKNDRKNKEFNSPLHNPKKVRCCDCQELFALKFVIPKWDYSQKNNWDYWTGKEEDKGKHKCNSCLLNLYYNHKQNYWSLVNNPQKRQKMRTYVYDGTISA